MTTHAAMDALMSDAVAFKCSVMGALLVCIGLIFTGMGILLLWSATTRRWLF